MLWSRFFIHLIMWFWCLFISSYHPAQFQELSCTFRLCGQFFSANFNMHIHCSLSSWTILLREACGHHWGLISFFWQRKFVMVGCGFCCSLICIGVNCHSWSSVFLIYHCSAPFHAILDVFVLLAIILCIFQQMFDRSAHLHSAHTDSALNC